MAHMIKKGIQYEQVQETIRRRALRALSVAASIRRLLELIKAGWQFVPQVQRPMPFSFKKLLSTSRP